jgi:hypothetical protein
MARLTADLWRRFEALCESLCARELPAPEQAQCASALFALAVGRPALLPPTNAPPLPAIRPGDRLRSPRALAALLRFLEVCGYAARREGIAALGALMESAGSNAEVLVGLEGWADLVLRLVRGIGGVKEGTDHTGEAEEMWGAVVAVLERAIRHSQLGTQGWIVLRSGLSALARSHVPHQAEDPAAAEAVMVGAARRLLFAAGEALSEALGASPGWDCLGREAEGEQRWFFTEAVRDNIGGLLAAAQLVAAAPWSEQARAREIATPWDTLNHREWLPRVLRAQAQSSAAGFSGGAEWTEERAVAALPLALLDAAFMLPEAPAAGPSAGPEGPPSTAFCSNDAAKNAAILGRRLGVSGAVVSDAGPEGSPGGWSRAAWYLATLLAAQSLVTARVLQQGSGAAALDCEQLRLACTTLVRRVPWGVVHDADWDARATHSVMLLAELSRLASDWRERCEAEGWVTEDAGLFQGDEPESQGEAFLDTWSGWNSKAADEALAGAALHLARFTQQQDLHLLSQGRLRARRTEAPPVPAVAVAAPRGVEVLHAPLERGLAGLLPEWDTQTVGVSHSSAASVSAVDATGGACSPRVSGGAESAGEGGAVEGQDSVGTLGARERLAALDWNAAEVAARARWAALGVAAEETAIVQRWDEAMRREEAHLDAAGDATARVESGGGSDAEGPAEGLGLDLTARCLAAVEAAAGRRALCRAADQAAASAAARGEELALLTAARRSAALASRVGRDNSLFSLVAHGTAGDGADAESHEGGWRQIACENRSRMRVACGFVGGFARGLPASFAATCQRRAASTPSRGRAPHPAPPTRLPNRAM